MSAVSAYVGATDVRDEEFHLLSSDICICPSACCCGQMPGKKHLKGGDSFFSLSFGNYSPSWWEAGRQDQLMAVAAR